MWFLIATWCAKAWAWHNSHHWCSVGLAFQNGNLITRVLVGLKVLQMLPTAYWSQALPQQGKKVIHKWTSPYLYRLIPYLSPPLLSTSPPLLPWSFISPRSALSSYYPIVTGLAVKRPGLPFTLSKTVCPFPLLVCEPLCETHCLLS